MDKVVYRGYVRFYTNEVRGFEIWGESLGQCKGEINKELDNIKCLIVESGFYTKEEAESLRIGILVDGREGLSKREEIQVETDWNRKNRTIHEIIKQCKIKSVLDIIRMRYHEEDSEEEAAKYMKLCLNLLNTRPEKPKAETYVRVRRIKINKETRAQEMETMLKIIGPEYAKELEDFEGNISSKLEEYYDVDGKVKGMPVATVLELKKTFRMAGILCRRREHKRI